VVEIKSAATFQSEFLRGLHAFEHSLPDGARVTHRVWYNGEREFTHDGVAVSNPLLHGFDVAPKPGITPAN
jgi:hypothetical protein